MNRNTLYSQVLADEMARSGLQHIVIAPGSRNTPLVLAFAHHPRVRVWSVLDERSAAFMALGLAVATDTPVAMLCTSGSAAANFFPAIVEARQSRIPLIVITADRPPELRFSGANQTIDQVKIFGDYALWSVDMSLPEADMPADAFRNLRTTANRAFAVANGSPKGVVHLNVPFRKPLEPTPVSTDRTTPPDDAHERPMHAPYTTITRGTIALNDLQLDMLANVIDTYERGIIVCGPHTPRPAFAAVARLGLQTSYPLFVDGTTGLRNGYPQTMGAFDTFLSVSAPLPEPPDVVIRFGDVPTSQALSNYLDRITPAYRIHISGDGTWADDSHRTTHFLVADEKLACMQLFGRFTNREKGDWFQAWHDLETRTRAAIHNHMANAPMFDASAIYAALRALPVHTRLFIGNSLPARHLDQFDLPDHRKMDVFATRGASGTDGNVSVAVGIAAADPTRPVVAILGDITLYHDMNGLMALQRLGIPMTFIVINNDGGGIFHRLPIRNYEPAFTDLFITPHGLTFEHAARLYGLSYAAPGSLAELTAALDKSLGTRAPTLIEIRTDGRHDQRLRSELMDEVKKALGSHEIVA
jgi:2-succinyl-5-enolpyruvyl-6-hydroxy-3-cyclohexene-1-carboxylate synthase